MNSLQVIEIKGQRVLTTKQIAEAYGTESERVKRNFENNKAKYKLGKHFIVLTGNELKDFKKQVGNPHLVANRASHLYLWTEKGALLHAKSLNTDKAWEVYDYLVDFYFRAKETLEEKKMTSAETCAEKRERRVSRKINVEQDATLYNAIQKIRKDLICMDVLLRECMRAKWESTYDKQISAAMEVVGYIVKDFNSMSDLAPRIVEEVYY